MQDSSQDKIWNTSKSDGDKPVAKNFAPVGDAKGDLLALEKFFGANNDINWETDRVVGVSSRDEGEEYRIYFATNRPKSREVGADEVSDLDALVDSLPLEKSIVEPGESMRAHGFSYRDSDYQLMGMWVVYGDGVLHSLSPLASGKDLSEKFSDGDCCALSSLELMDKGLERAKNQALGIKKDFEYLVSAGEGFAELNGVMIGTTNVYNKKYRHGLEKRVKRGDFAHDKRIPILVSLNEEVNEVSLEEYYNTIKLNAGFRDVGMASGVLKNLQVCHPRLKSDFKMAVGADDSKVLNGILQLEGIKQYRKLGIINVELPLALRREVYRCAEAVRDDLPKGSLARFDEIKSALVDKFGDIYSFANESNVNDVVESLIMQPSAVGGGARYSLPLQGATSLLEIEDVNLWGRSVDGDGNSAVGMADFSTTNFEVEHNAEEFKSKLRLLRGDVLFLRFYLTQFKNNSTLREQVGDAPGLGGEVQRCQKYIRNLFKSEKVGAVRTAKDRYVDDAHLYSGYNFDSVERDIREYQKGVDTLVLRFLGSPNATLGRSDLVELANFQRNTNVIADRVCNAIGVIRQAQRVYARYSAFGLGAVAGSAHVMFTNKPNSDFQKSEHYISGKEVLQDSTEVFLSLDELMSAMSGVFGAYHARLYFGDFGASEDRRVHVVLRSTSTSPKEVAMQYLSASSGLPEMSEVSQDLEVEINAHLAYSKDLPKDRAEVLLSELSELLGEFGIKHQLASFDMNSNLPDYRLVPISISGQAVAIVELVTRLQNYLLSGGKVVRGNRARRKTVVTKAPVEVAVGSGNVSVSTIPDKEVVSFVALYSRDPKSGEDQELNLARENQTLQGGLAEAQTFQSRVFRLDGESGMSDILPRLLSCYKILGPAKPETSASIGQPNVSAGAGSNDTSQSR